MSLCDTIKEYANLTNTPKSLVIDNVEAKIDVRTLAWYGFTNLGDNKWLLKKMYLESALEKCDGVNPADEAIKAYWEHEGSRHGKNITK